MVASNFQTDTFDGFPESMKDRPLKGKGLSGFGVGCPIGTVPIRRVEKEDLILAKAFSKLHTKAYAENCHPLADGPIHLVTFAFKCLT